MFGNNEAQAFVIQHPEKSGMPGYSVAVSVTENANCADLKARPCALGNERVGLEGSLCSYCENVSLTADKSNRLNILKIGVKTRNLPRLIETSAIRQIAAESVDNSVISSGVDEREPDKLVPIVIVFRPLDVSQNNPWPVCGDEVATRQIGLLASGNPQRCRECCDDKTRDCCQSYAVAVHEATATPHVGGDDGTDTGVAFFGGLIAFIAALLTYTFLEKRR